MSDDIKIMGMTEEELMQYIRDNPQQMGVVENTEIQIFFKKVHELAVIPQYATPGSSGFDLVAIEDCYLIPGIITPVRTGLCVELPDPDSTYPFTLEMEVRPRSGLARKYGVTIPNTPCTIDNDYRGELVIPMTVIKYSIDDQLEIIKQGYQIKAGDRIAQGIINPVFSSNIIKILESTDLNETERGSNGFGSTGI
jgi:dUTP pyrophosphatase